MRYDRKVTFRKYRPGAYNSTTGNYEPSTIDYSDERSAAVTGTSRKYMELLYGKIREDSVTIHLQNQYSRPFDRIIIDEVPYQADLTRNLRTKQIIVCTEAK